MMRIDKADFDTYTVTLKDKSRPPSRGGNRRAWHRHAISINGDVYSFLAPWSGKFAFKGESVSFDWEWDESKTYRNVDRDSFLAFKSDGSEQLRGERGEKAWRTADTRPPGRRSEWKD